MGIYFVVTCIVYRRNKVLTWNELIDFATQYGTVQKQLLNEFEIPYGLMDASGKLLWINQAFSDLTGKEKRYHKSITSIFPQITKEQLEKNDENNFMIEWEEKALRASVKKIYFRELPSEQSVVEDKTGNQYLEVIYLYDETRLQNYIRENQDMKLVAALVYIDNFDEVMDSIEEVKQSLLVAIVDRKVNKYFSAVDALVKKTEKDKYFVVFKQRYLEKLEEDKYSILEDVKNIKAGNEIAITLSIGIGSGCKEYVQNMSMPVHPLTWLWVVAAIRSCVRHGMTYFILVATAVRAARIPV